MAPPLTDAKTLERDKDSMRVRMELMILRTQKEICSALEKEEEVRYNSFRVDRWERKEGGGGITCIIQVGKFDVEALL